MTGTDIERRPSSGPTVPAAEWALMNSQAEALATSDIIPSAYKRKPANVLVAALTGRQHGWDVMTSMNQGHVIEGRWGMKPEAMVGLVRQAGHSVTGEVRADGATVTGVRADNGDTMTFTFSLDDALRANLCRLKDGKPFARSQSGKPLPWEQYPSTMCWWRAVGLLCRVLFSDVTMGAHSAEELGASISEEGDVIDVGEVEHASEGPQELSDEAIAKFRRRCEEREVDSDAVLHRAFADGVPAPLLDEHLPAMRDAFKEMVAEGEGDIVDGEVVEDAEDAEDAEASGWVSAETGEAPAPADDGSMRPATKHQVGKIKGEYKRLKVEDRDEQLATTVALIGHDITSHNKLTWQEASATISTLTGYETPPEQTEMDLEGG